MLLLDLDSWSIPEQIDFICRATRITINFCSRPYGKVTAAHWKWLNFWKFAPSVLLSLLSISIMSTSTAIFTPKEALFRDFLTWEHILESFKLSESVSTFILSWKLSLLDLICSQLSENALRAKSRVFCHFWSFETLAFFTFCWFWPSRSHWRPFLDLESTKALWLSYPNLFLHLIYLYPFPCKSSGKIDSFFMAEQSK